MMYKCIWLFLFLLYSITVWSVKPSFDLINAPELKSASVGICILDVETGNILVNQDMHRALVPASALKVITTATALELFGADYQFKTRLQYSGYINKEGILQGDLWIIGGGDPTLGSEYSPIPSNQFINGCMAKIKEAGIRKVQGRIVADDRLFDTEGVSPKWTWEDIGNYYAAGSYGLNYADNRFRLVLSTGQEGSIPDIVKTIPEVQGITFRNHLTVKNNGKDSSYIYGAPFSRERSLYGSAPANRKDFTIKGDLPDPALFLADELTSLLRKTGIEVTEPATTARILEESHTFKQPVRKELFQFSSDRLADIVRSTNVRSDNLYAETLLRLIALSRYKTGSSVKGLEVLADYWHKKGIDIGGLFMHDGCGLSPLNRISPDFLCQVLSRMFRNESFRKSLPLAGVEGTVKSFLRNSPLAGKMRLKSGSIENIQCYAGYGEKDGRTYAVVIMINHFQGDRKLVVQKLERYLLSIF